MPSLKPLKNINQLPSIEKVIEISQSLAMLDAILMPDWEYRYFSFNKEWNINQYMASMRDGEGSHYYILFDLVNKTSCCLGKIYDNELPNNKEIHSQIKTLKNFNKFLDEVAFENIDASFYFYYSYETNHWEVVPSTDNIPFLGMMKDKEKAYISWAEKYYEVKIDRDTVTKIFNFIPLDDNMIANLNPNITAHEILEDIKEIGYPYKG